jgi:ABC-type sugar transport system ATPase subunit
VVGDSKGRQLRQDGAILRPHLNLFHLSIYYARMLSANPIDGSSCLAEARCVSKFFPGVKALDGVSVSFKAGEVHAVMGGNGAGKSTLVGLFAGLHQPDSGEIVVKERKRSFRQPFEAIDAGVSVIHQELTVLPNLSVAENIFLGNLPTNRLGLLDRQTLHRNAAAILDQLALDIDPAQPVLHLSIAARQMVEIAKAVSCDPFLILMDEPTSSIGRNEAERLFKIVDLLREQNRAVVYVSHKMDEVMALADRITVLRDGAHVLTEPRSTLDEKTVVNAMVGRELSLAKPTQPKANPAPLLEVTGLSRKGDFEDVSFTLHSGEILGMAGLVGAGRSAVAQSLFGALSTDSGAVSLNGRIQAFKTPADAMNAGLALVPENRQAEGLLLEMSVQENLVLSKSSKLANFGILDRFSELKLAKHWIKRLGIRLTGPNQKVATLSGGNQQKVALGRSLALEPCVLLVDEPTRGVDIGAKWEIHQILRQAAADGMAILLISSEMEELLSLSDRVVVMRSGRVVATLRREDATEQVIGAHTLGLADNG